VTEELVINTVAMVLTLVVLSRVVGNNPAFRVAQYMFVGVSLGYAFVILYHQVIKPAIVQTLSSSTPPFLAVLTIIPFLLGLLLLPRIIGRQRLSWLANIPLGLIFGVSAALALSGALAGTLLPQIVDTAAISINGALFTLAGGVVLVVGVILVMSYFYFTIPQRSGMMAISALSAKLGRWLLIITFGFFLAGALITYVTALSDRLQFLVNWVWLVIDSIR
jgi:hypothetical protein